MLMPKRTKWRKQMRGQAFAAKRRVAMRSRLASTACSRWNRRGLSARVIEAGRVAASRNAPEAKLWIRVFPHKSVSKKPAETRMGTGKGDVEFWAAVIKPGTILYELDGVTEDAAKRAFNRVAHKLPMRVRLVRRRHA
jgi:large subunit ribosomal protein L16